MPVSSRRGTFTIVGSVFLSIFLGSRHILRFSPLTSVFHFGPIKSLHFLSFISASTSSRCLNFPPSCEIGERLADAIFAFFSLKNLVLVPSPPS